MTLRKVSVWIILSVISINFFAGLKAQEAEPPFLKYMYHSWVDSVLSTLSVEQMIAQSIWVAAYSNRDLSHEVEVVDLIRKFGIGGIVFFQGTAEKQAELTNYYQKISKVPLLISMDAEWGPGMRLDNIERYPYQMTLGALQNDSLIYLMGKCIARQCKRLGVHINFAPVADINNNQANPVINYRSFGENRENVTAKALMYMKGMQDNGVMATIKHFPGHGDTNTDSHLDLPVISHLRARLDSVEMFPFRRLIQEGAGCIMTAHLSLPSLDPVSKLPSTLSSPIITELLKKQLGFKGLVISDAMNMKGVTKYFEPGAADARAYAAGNDVIEFVTDVDAAIREIKKQLSEGKITIPDINLKCRKVLAMKYWSGLNRMKNIKTEKITSEISSNSAKALIRDLYANAITVLSNKNNIIPVKNLERIKVAAVAINRKSFSLFQKRIIDYHPADTFFINPSDSKAVDDLISKLQGYDLVIAGIFGTDQRPNFNFGINPELDGFLRNLIQSNKTIITYFGNPYAINKLPSLQDSEGLILSYQENQHTEDLSAQLIFGGIGGCGLLPVTINNTWPSGFGITTKGYLRVMYGLPENGGLRSEILEKRIDSVVNIGLSAKAFPGCLVMVARKGIVVFQKTYGYQTYDNRILIREDDLFDLASVTKVSSTLAGLMLLDSEGKFTPERTLGYYLPYFRKSDKENLLMKDLLTHQSGLTAWIPFWKETIKNDSVFKRKIFNSDFSERYPVKVADHLFINKNYREKIFKEIKKSPLGEKKYVYSDLTFIIAPSIIEALTGEKWYEFVTRNIYQKIGAFDIGFNPYLKYPTTRIIPTEYDSLFRRQLLHGTVHDEGAAMLGGISGHAGLFSTANDLMKLVELYRRMGDYGGEQLISREVMERYTRVQFPENKNRRGLGFDKPFLNNSELGPKEAYPAKSASPESFGHSGYTGTFIWVDPVCEISYIFLSNRVYPTRNNNLLSDLNIRPDIMQVIYDSIR